MRTTVAAAVIKVLAAIIFWFVGRWRIGQVIRLVQGAASVQGRRLRQQRGITGTVHELGLLGTTIVTPDNVLTLVGNGKIFADTIQNFSALPYRRVDRTAQLAAGVDHAEANARFRAAVGRIPHVTTEPAPDVSLLDINLLGAVIAVRPYCHTDHYWQVYFDTNEAIVRVCREAGWPAPTPASITRMMQLPA